MLNSEKTSVPSGSLFAIVDERVTADIRRGFCAHGFSVITLPKDPRLGEAVASHTDMLFFRHKSTLIGSRSYLLRHSGIEEQLSGLGFTVIRSEAEFCRDYPYDAVLNALVIGDKLFCKADTVCRDILKYAERASLRTVNVRQGYPACTTLALNDRLAVTSDKGMARALEREGIEAILIEESDKILLPPYKNGFIGGAACTLRNKIYFLGNLGALPCHDMLERRASDASIELISLSPDSDSLLDLGGAVLCHGGF